MTMKVFVLSCLIFILTLSCQEKVHTLDQSYIEQITYKELPKAVKLFIRIEIDSIIDSNREVYHSTDQSVVFTYGRSGVSDSWIEEVNSNYHHFFVDGVHYRLVGNRGDPFILDNDYLYFADLNLYKDDYTERPFYRIRID